MLERIHCLSSQPLISGEVVTSASLGNTRVTILSKTATEDDMLKWRFSVASDTHTQH